MIQGLLTICGDVVLCMESGSRFIGIEIGRAHFDTACVRIEAAQDKQ
ncbi:hypothetical protein [Thioflavicoccus mobilis]|nr:hypothetical protein [Thioflavicoccus mobilis]